MLIKRILSVLAILCMLGFVVSVLCLLFGIGYATMQPWIYGSMAAFLIIGLSTLLIDYLQKRAAEEKEKK